MNLNVSPEWLLEKAEQEAGGIISVGGWLNTCTPATPGDMKFDLQEMLATVRKFQEEQRRIDDGMMDALRKVFGGDSWGYLLTMSSALKVSPLKLLDYFEGERPLMAEFYDAIKAWADKMSKK